MSLSRLGHKNSNLGLGATSLLRDEASFRYELAKFFFKNGESHYFYQPPHLVIHAKFFSRDDNHRLLAISPGLGESCLKYVELVRDLAGEEFDIVVLDHRGQGLSSRPNSNASVNHIDKFEDYTEDFAAIVGTFKLRKKYSTCILLGQDVGCLIGLQAILKEGRLFDGAILSSPAFGFHLGMIPEVLALALLKILQWPGLAARPLPGKYCPLIRSFERNQGTTCRRRFSLHRYFEKLYPQVRFRSPSVRWFYQTMKNARQVLTQAKSLKLPILLMQAGEDRLSRRDLQEDFSQAVQNSRLIRLKEGRHEIFQEVDFIRGRALVQVRKFLREIRGPEENLKSPVSPQDLIKKSA